MADRISQIVTALTSLSEAIEEGGLPHGDKTMRELWGWNVPAMTFKQLGSMARLLGAKIGRIPDSSVNANFGPQTIISRIDDFKVNTMPYLFNGNSAGAAPTYFGLLQWIELVFEPVYEAKIDWEKLADAGQLPKKLTAKLRSFNTRINRLDVDFESIDQKIEYINQAHDAAEALPTDLETLRAANEEVAEAKADVERNKILSDVAQGEVEQLLDRMRESEAEARQLLVNTEDAYSAATTRGLGESFRLRAESLAWSMWAWVGGLVVALGFGAIIGHYRVAALQELLEKNANSGAVTLSSMLAIISVAAPVWFAWIATKQIGHRFRLSEDYAFKASVAQAYEGYRREAARIDENFARRLFGSALDRLEEAPIRFVEHETFGSPWHEFVRLRQKRSIPVGDETQKPVTPVSTREG